MLAGAVLSNFCLLGRFQCIVGLDPKASDSALQFGVPEQKLDGTKVLDPPVNQCGFGRRMECVP